MTEEKEKKLKKLHRAFNYQREKLQYELEEQAPNIKNIIEILQITAKICKQKIEIGSPFKAKTFGKDSYWYKACHLVYEEGRSHEVPPFFRKRIPVPSQSTAGANSQGRNLLGGWIDGEIAADIMAGRPVTGGSVTGGSRKRRRT